MTGYVIANYRITNAEAYKDYPPAVTATLLACGADVLVADYESEVVEGEASSVTVVLRSPSKEAARAWYKSSDYQKIIRHRTDNTEGFILFADEFIMP